MDDVEDDRKPAARNTDSPVETSAETPFSSDTCTKKAKPALIKDSKKKKQPEEKKHLQWDEEKIEEHDKLRGTRMKIDEPNTPYTHYDSGAESDDSRRPKSPAANEKHTALSWDNLNTRLESVAAVRDAYPSSPEDNNADSGGAGGGASNSDEDVRNKEMRKLEFKEHRKRHYNEMEVVRRFRQENLDDEEVPNGHAEDEH
jgi:protein phosphatase inhibitor 2